MQTYKSAKAQLIYAALGVNFLIAFYFWWHNSGSEALRTSTGLITALSRLCGLWGALFIIMDFVLIARLPIVEQVLGRAVQLKLHKWAGYAAFSLIFAHFTLMTIGYAIVDRLSIVGQFVSFITTFPDVWQAVIAVILLIVVVGLSISIARRHLKYEFWYFVHLLSYLLILLAFGHQLKNGADFIGQPLFVAYWWFLYIMLFVLVVGYRFLRPLWLSFDHRLRVARVEAETHDTFSVYVKGRGLDRLSFRGGQFAIWWFLDPKRFWQGHPFSLSAPPDGRQLRLTFKRSGDFTAGLDQVKPGTPVVMDGPYGIFTTAAVVRPKLLLIAGGIGLTPIIAMMDETKRFAKDIVVLYSARTEADLALRKELEAAARRHGAKVVYIISDDPAYRGETGRLDQDKLKRLVPDAAERQVFLCGPPPMMAAISQALKRLGVPPELIVTEDFNF